MQWISSLFITQSCWKLACWCMTYLFYSEVLNLFSGTCKSVKNPINRILSKYICWGEGKAINMKKFGNRGLKWLPCLVFMERLFKRKFCFKLKVHSLNYYFLSFILYSPSLSSPFPSVSFLFIIEKISPWEKILDSLILCMSCKFHCFMPLCLWLNACWIFEAYFSPFKFRYASFNVRILNFKCI